MESTPARRVRIYLNEDDRYRGALAYRAVLQLLQAEQARGATVLRAVEGFGAGGRLHAASLVDVAARLPLVVEWIDTPAQVERLLPRVLERVEHGLVTVDETTLAQAPAPPVRALRPTATVDTVMSRDVLAVAPGTPLRRVVDLMLGRTYRAVPVVDGGRPVGIVTSSDLVHRGGLGVRLELARALDRPELHELLERLSARPRAAAEVMTPDPVTVTPATPLPVAAALMVRRRLKRLPVIDEAGRLVGMVSRLDLLRAASAGAEAAAPEAAELGLQGDVPLAQVMRRDAPTVLPETPLAEVIQAVLATRLHRALVVDAERRVVGLVSDAELLERISPALRPGALRAFMNRLPFVHPRGEQAGGRTAADVMSPAVAQAGEEALLSEAITRMLPGGQKVLAVTDREGRLAGVVDRADLLHGLVPAGG